MIIFGNPPELAHGFLYRGKQPHAVILCRILVHTNGNHGFLGLAQNQGQHLQPVSYTHLDVYKRQLQSLGFMNTHHPNHVGALRKSRRGSQVGVLLLKPVDKADKAGKPQKTTGLKAQRQRENFRFRHPSASPHNKWDQ